MTVIYLLLGSFLLSYALKDLGLSTWRHVALGSGLYFLALVAVSWGTT